MSSASQHAAAEELRNLSLTEAEAEALDRGEVDAVCEMLASRQRTVARLLVGALVLFVIAVVIGVVWGDGSYGSGPFIVFVVPWFAILGMRAKIQHHLARARALRTGYTGD